MRNCISAITFKKGTICGNYCLIAGNLQVIGYGRTSFTAAHNAYRKEHICLNLLTGETITMLDCSLYTLRGK